VFALTAVLVYLAGAALLAIWPMLSAMSSMMGAGGMLIRLLLWGSLLVLVIWALLRILDSGGRGPRGADLVESRDPAEEALRERFARGEIGAAEYEDSLRTLRGESLQRRPGEDRSLGAGERG
jgi:putative membrane protein